MWLTKKAQGFSQKNIEKADKYADISENLFHTDYVFMSLWVAKYYLWAAHCWAALSGATLELSRSIHEWILK
jgi:hypothetical protein